MPTDAIRFTRKLCLFLTPFAFFFLIPLIVLTAGGELMPLTEVVDRQLATDVPPNMVGHLYSNQATPYKYLMTCRLRSPILILGSSRALQFRQFFFSRPSYSTGTATNSLSQIRYFLENLPAQYRPAVMIIGLDQRFFCDTRLEGTEALKRYAHRLHSVRPGVNILATKSIVVWRDLLQDKYDLRELFCSPRRGIGICPLVFRAGYRPDGSFSYGTHVQTAPQRLTQDLARIPAGKVGFEHAAQVNAHSLNILRDLLALCHEKGAFVIGFLPPYAPAALEIMRARRDDYAYLFTLRETIAPLFDIYRYRLFDYTDTVPLGTSNDEFLDGWHGSEVVYLRIYLDMLDHCPELRPYSADRELLRRTLRERASGYLLWDED